MGLSGSGGRVEVGVGAAPNYGSPRGPAGVNPRSGFTHSFDSRGLPDQAG